MSLTYLFSLFKHKFSTKNLLYQISQKVELKDRKSLILSPFDFQPDLFKIIYLLKQGNQTDQESKYIQNYFEKNFKYFQHVTDKLSSEMIQQLFKEINYIYSDPFQLLFAQGEIGRKMYFVLEGSLYVIIQNDTSVKLTENTKLSTLDFSRMQTNSIDELIENHFKDLKIVNIKSNGDHFGEIAIEQKQPRTASIITKTPCHLAFLSFDSYQRIIAKYQEQLINAKINFLKSIPIFEPLQRQKIQMFLHCCEEVQYGPQTIIFKLSQPSNSVYLIKEGEVKLTQFKYCSEIIKEEEIKLMKKKGSVIDQVEYLAKGQIFGHQELIQNNFEVFPHQILLRKSECATITNVELLKIKFSSFIDNINVLELKSHFINMCLRKNIIVYQLQQNSILMQKEVLKNKIKENLNKKLGKFCVLDEKQGIFQKVVNENELTKQISPQKQVLAIEEAVNDKRNQKNLRKGLKSNILRNGSIGEKGDFRLESIFSPKSDSAGHDRLIRESYRRESEIRLKQSLDKELPYMKVFSWGGDNKFNTYSSQFGRKTRIVHGLAFSKSSSILNSQIE